LLFAEKGATHNALSMNFVRSSPVSLLHKKGFVELRSLSHVFI